MSIHTLSIFGTRPEAIKMAPVLKRLALDSRFKSQLCVTGQHDSMLNSVLDLFKLIPDFRLHVMEKHQSLSRLTSKILLGLTDIFEKTKPDFILVHGDTTTTLAASLAAYYDKIPVVHIEAGLRTQDIYSPWPEEVNRKLTGSLAALHFAPTQSSRLNLLHEGIDPDKIFVTGNTVIDALFDVLHSFDVNPDLRLLLQQQFSFLSAERKFILVTSHRRESFGEDFEQICQGLLRISCLFPEVDIVYPVHLNPNIQATSYALLSGVSNIFLIPPVDYLSFVYLMKASHLILTDSGGVQEEASSLGKPVLVMRKKTERPEALDAGTVVLVGTNPKIIIEYVTRLLQDESYYQKMSQAINPYGDGLAADRIIHVLAEHYSLISA